MWLVAAIGSCGFGLPFLAGGVSTDEHRGIAMFSAIVIAFAAGAFLWMAFASASTFVRFTVTDDEVIIEWRMRGRSLRSQRVARVDLVDVSISDAPTSGGGREYNLAIGTKNGDIALSSTYTPWKSSYLAKRDVLTKLLAVPARPE